MSFSQSTQRSEKAKAASQANGRKSLGPKTAQGKSRSARNSFKHGLYAKPDADTRRQMFNVGEDPDRLESLERDLREALQPANAMEALVIADIAKIYMEKDLLETTVRNVRATQEGFAGHLLPYDNEQFHSRIIPGNEYWGKVLKQMGRLDWRIEAKLNLLLRLKRQWQAAGDEWQEEDRQPPASGPQDSTGDGESVEEAVQPEDATLSDEAHPVEGGGGDGTNPAS